jgi:hypothetical protein
MMARAQGRPALTQLPLQMSSLKLLPLGEPNLAPVPTDRTDRHKAGINLPGCSGGAQKREGRFLMLGLCG